jgi:hypothetical protein
MVTSTVPTLLNHPDSPERVDEKDILEPNVPSESTVYDLPMKYRIAAFSMIVLFSTGSAFAEYTLGPLKSTLIKNLGITSKLAYVGYRLTLQTLDSLVSVRRVTS